MPPEIDDEMLSFDRVIGATFAALAVALLLTTALQVRFGLLPLQRISESLAAIRSGHRRAARGPVPGRDRRRWRARPTR